MSLKIRFIQAKLDEGVEHGDSWVDEEGKNMVVSLQKVHGNPQFIDLEDKEFWGSRNFSFRCLKRKRRSATVEGGRLNQLTQGRLVLRYSVGS
ncbi:hypothetical protein SUGI_1184450 [Cryptomeria japonica]|nr:hypothetical protein SUGI_1184450 [Cryptomeria japonica]